MSKSLLIFLIFLYPTFSTVPSEKNFFPYSVTLYPIDQNPGVRQKPFFSTTETTPEESFWRRGEIIFFVSLPFTLLLNTAATYLVYQQATGKSRFPPYLWFFSVTGGILFSAAIVVQDQASLHSQNTYFFQIQYPFKR